MVFGLWKSDTNNPEDLAAPLTSGQSSGHPDNENLEAAQPPPAPPPHYGDERTHAINDCETTNCDQREQCYMADLSVEQRDAKPSCASRGWQFACSSPKRQCCSCLVVVLVLAVIMVPILICAVVPSLTSHYVHGATIRLVQARIGNISATQAHLDAEVVIGNAGPFDASLDSFDASLSYEGTAFGTLPFPSMDINANAEHTIQLSVELQVHNGAAMAKSLQPAFKGEASHWQIGGSVDVTVFGILHPSVDLDNPIPLPSMQLQQVRAQNMEPRSGNGTTGELIADVDLTFYSPSILEVSDIGDITLEYYSANDIDIADALAPRQKVGTVVISSFGISRGLNRFRATFFGRLEQSNYDTMATIFQKYSSQQDNIGVVNGPISNSKGADYLLHVMTQQFAMAGSPAAMFPAALMNRASTVQGFNPITGKPCAVIKDGGDLDHCLRGAMITGAQVFQKRMVYKNFVFDTYWDNPLPAYEFTFDFSTIVSSVKCRSTNIVGQLVSPPGISVSDAGAKAGTRQHEYTVGNLTRNITNIGGWESLVDAKDFTFFLGAKDAPGQAEKVVIPNPGTYPTPLPGNKSDYRCFGSLGPLDCCMTSSFTAATCLAKQKGQKTIPMTSTGNVTLYIDTWTINITSTQHLQVTSEDAVMDFSIYDHVLGYYVVGWNCSAFNYTMG